MARVDAEATVTEMDPALEEASALGVRNAEIITRFERFCRNVRVEAHGGGGMLEAATGLPIGLRSFRCEFADGSISASSNLEDLGLDFYEANCRGCAHRSPTGHLGGTIDELADRRRDGRAEQAQLEQSRVDAAAAEHAVRSADRGRQMLGQPFEVVEQLRLVDRLDPVGGTPDPEAIQALESIARAAPELMADSTVAGLMQLGAEGDQSSAGKSASLRVLRFLVEGGRIGPGETLPLALGALRLAPNADAGSLLVVCAAELDPHDVTGLVVKSAIQLAGMTGDPWGRVSARFGGDSPVDDPGPLRACLQVNSDAVLNGFEEMLRAASSYRTGPHLLGPGGDPIEPAADSPDPLEFADRERSIAAAASRHLIGDAGATDRLMSALLSSLEIADRDRYDAPPSQQVARTLSLALRQSPQSVGPIFVERAARLSAEGRNRAFRGVSEAIRSLDDTSVGGDVQAVIQLAIDRLSADWGRTVAMEAAITLDDLARFSPSLLAPRSRVLVGVLAGLHTQAPPEPSALIVPTDPLAGLNAIAEKQCHDTTLARLRGAIGRVIAAGADEAAEAVFDLLDIESDGTSDDIEVRVAATRLLGQIGQQPSRLAQVVPRLYRGLLDAEDTIRNAAVRSWGELAQ